MRIQVIGEPEQFITNLAIILRGRGEKELLLRVKRLSRHNLLHLCPDLGNKSDDELRAVVTRAVHVRLDRLNGFQSGVQVFLDRLDLDELKEEAGNNRKLTLGYDDIPGYTYQGGVKTTREQVRGLVRDIIENDRRVAEEESALWNKEVTARIRKENKKSGTGLPRRRNPGR